MKWNKKGHIFSVDNHAEWMVSHVQNPSAIILGDRIRVFFNTRPKPQNGLFVSHPTYIDLNAYYPSEVIEIASGPVLNLGELGCFDQHGCMSSSVIQCGSELLMFYVGWMRGCDVPYNWAIGIAVSYNDGQSFKRIDKGPIIGATLNEPYLQNAPCVLRITDDCWHMWYSTGKSWLKCNGKIESSYYLTHAISKDGFNWERSGEPILPEKFNHETQTAATVFEYSNIFHMYFSYRHSTNFRNCERGYRIGYASSSDLIDWKRDDNLAGISVSITGWDSEMICYPHVCNVGKRIYMFYCGNQFGKGGLGYAESFKP